MSLRGLFGGRPTASEETRALASEVRELRAHSLFFSTDVPSELVQMCMEELAANEGLSLGMRIGIPIAQLLRTLISWEPLSYVPHDHEAATLSEQVAERDRLRSAKRMLLDEARLVTKWASVIQTVLAGMYQEFPQQAFVDAETDGSFDELSALAPVVQLYTVIPDVPDIVQKIIGTIASRSAQEDGLFERLRDQFYSRVCNASGVHPDERYSTQKHLVLPKEQKGLADGELVELYMAGTPFYELLTLPIPLHIPEAVRFEHTHILAGTGHGKTQALQYLIAADLERAVSEKRSVVVMDSQGDMLETLMRSEFFREKGLAERLIYISPTDIDCPVGLNLFDIGLGQLGEVSALTRETIINGTIELYEYFFGGLLGAELTQKQGVIFRYLAMLMTHIPDANIHTLRELMEDGERFKPYMATLEGSARAFFETRFFDRAFTETKKQILNRLWGVLSSASLDRMMSAKRNSVDLFQSLQEGAIVFINTAKDFLGHEGSAIFSRMFVALLGQALMRRASVARHLRTPTYLYIDEAEDVVDLGLTRMLAQVRKYKGAITFAHQNLDQLDADIRAGVMANTSIKLAGGVSEKDARTLAGEFRCDAGFLLSQRRTRNETHFACFARNVTERAVTLSIPLGFLESKRRLADAEYEALLARSRERYGHEREASVVTTLPVPVVEPVPSLSSFPDEARPIIRAPIAASAELTPPPIVITRQEPLEGQSTKRRGMGHGGAKHQYLERLVKQLGEERGFLAQIEVPIHDGAGRVDVVLTRGDVVLAFEISVTTTKDHELGNVEKCLALPYTHIVMLTSHKRHHTSLSRFISAAVEDTDRKRLSFLLPEDVPGFLDIYPYARPVAERTVKGYVVRSKVKDGDPAEAMARRNAVGRIIARSEL